MINMCVYIDRYIYIYIYIYMYVYMCTDICIYIRFLVCRGLEACATTRALRQVRPNLPTNIIPANIA